VQLRKPSKHIARSSLDKCRVTFVTDQIVFHMSLIAIGVRADWRRRQADEN
jgi:hypothetical protein